MVEHPSTGSIRAVTGVILALLLAPAGTPPEIIEKLNTEIRRILATPELRKKLADQGTEVRAGPPEELGRFIRTEIPRWAKVVKQSGVKVD